MREFRLSRLRGHEVESSLKGRRVGVGERKVMKGRRVRVSECERVSVRGGEMETKKEQKKKRDTIERDQNIS